MIETNKDSFCQHGMLPGRCPPCDTIATWREALRAVVSTLPLCTHPNLDGGGRDRCDRPAVVRDKNGFSYRCADCLTPEWREHRVEGQETSEKALRQAIALLAEYDAKRGSGT